MSETKVEVGQEWMSNDKRLEHEVRYLRRFAIVEVLPDGVLGRGVVTGRPHRILMSRLRPNATGYVLAVAP